MRLRAAIAASAVAAGLLTAPAAGAAEPDATVEVRSNRYAPSVVHVPVGATVEWVAVDGNHDVRADDGSFHFHRERTLTPGERVSRTFDRDETVHFHCTLHGAPGGLGMAGVIVVGEGDPAPPPDDEPPQITVPTDTPSLRSAVQQAGPGTVINLQPGVYREAIGITKPQLRIRGLGDGPGDVVIDGSGHRPVGITVRADGVAIENLTVANHQQAGVLFDGVEGFRAERVTVTGPSAWGLRAHASRAGIVRGVSATDATVAGLAITGCESCDTVVSGVVAERNRWGVLLEDAVGVVLRGSTVRANGSGIVLRSPPGGTGQRGAHVVGNVVEGNVGSVGSASPPFDVSGGVGIWVAGGRLNAVQRNTVTGNRWGIVLTAQGGPASGNRVIDNVTGGSARADLAWDGVGSGSCFSGNRTAGGEEPTSEPPAVQRVSDCALPTTVGVPSPLVHVDLITGP